MRVGQQLASKVDSSVQQPPPPLAPWSPRPPRPPPCWGPPSQTARCGSGGQTSGPSGCTAPRPAASSTAWCTRRVGMLVRQGVGRWPGAQAGMTPGGADKSERTQHSRCALAQRGDAPHHHLCLSTRQTREKQGGCRSPHLLEHLLRRGHASHHALQQLAQLLRAQRLHLTATFCVASGCTGAGWEVERPEFRLDRSLVLAKDATYLLRLCILCVGV